MRLPPYPFRILPRLAALTLLSALLLPACQPPVSLFGGAGMDMFAPVSLRIHQLSRILPSATAPATAPTARPTAPPPPPILEARLELADQFADPAKSTGTLTLALYDQPPLTHKGDLLQTWTFSLNTPQENRDHWDRTLRMYLFKLPLVKTLPQRDRLLLTAELTLPNGMTLTDERELPLK